MKYTCLTSTFIFLATSSLASAEVKVMASIKPIHSLVAAVMEGVGTPGLVVSGNNSPHTYALKPKDAEALQDAQVIFWIGHEMEAFLEKPLESLGGNSRIVTLIAAPGVNTLPVREGNGFDKDDDEGEVHEAGSADGHIWLDPENAKAMVQTIADELSQQDPTNAAAYSSNAAKEIAELDGLSKEITEMVAPAKGKGFIVFHDAYHYFENRFGLRASGAITIHPESTPGAKGIAEIKQRISDGKVTCVFAEPQFDNALITALVEGTTVKAATLDPEGSPLEPGPDLYPTLLRNIARNLSSCLSET
jgi:zinc transport system substrate-binding protein